VKKYYHLSLLLSLVILAVILSSGCKENATESPKATDTGSRWQLDPSYFRSDKILLNGYVSNNTFTVAGFCSISVADSTSLSPKMQMDVGLNSLASKPVCSGDYWAYGGTNGAQFVFFSPFYYRGSVNSAVPFYWRLILHDLDSSYSTSAAAYPNYYTNPIGAFNNQHQFLSAIADTNGISSFCLIDMSPSYTPTSFAEPLAAFSPKVTKITLHGDDQYLNYVASITSYKEKFFVSTARGNYIAYPNGTYRALSQVSGYLSDVFVYHDTLYTLTAFEELYRSSDQGETWSLFASNFPSGQAKSFYIGSKLYFYIYSQIFQADFTTGIVQELDNSGLEYNEITSINQYGDKVWVTTLSGMFYTSSDKFLTYKPPTSLSKNNNRMMSKKITLHKRN
jgi:hypothetical protein